MVQLHKRLRLHSAWQRWRGCLRSYLCRRARRNARNRRRSKDWLRYGKRHEVWQDVCLQPCRSLNKFSPFLWPRMYWHCWKKFTSKGSSARSALFIIVLIELMNLTERLLWKTNETIQKTLQNNLWRLIFRLWNSPVWWTASRRAWLHRATGQNFQTSWDELLEVVQKAEPVSHWFYFIFGGLRHDNRIHKRYALQANWYAHGVAEVANRSSR